MIRVLVKVSIHRLTVELRLRSYTRPIPRLLSLIRGIDASAVRITSGTTRPLGFTLCETEAATVNEHV